MGYNKNITQRELLCILITHMENCSECNLEDDKITKMCPYAMELFSILVSSICKE